MIVNREKRTIEMVLEDGARHTTNAKDPAVYEMARFDQLIVSLDPESVFPRAGPARGEREMTIAELETRIAELKAQNLPYHNPVMEIQKKFSLPAACLVFALVGVGLGDQQSQGRQARELRARHRRHLRLLRGHVHGAGDDEGRADSGVARACGCRTSCSAPPDWR